MVGNPHTVVANLQPLHSDQCISKSNVRRNIVNNVRRSTVYKTVYSVLISPGPEGIQAPDNSEAIQLRECG